MPDWKSYKIAEWWFDNYKKIIKATHSQIKHLPFWFLLIQSYIPDDSNYEC